MELALTERAVRVSVSDPKGEVLPTLREATADDMEDARTDTRVTPAFPGVRPSPRR